MTVKALWTKVPSDPDVFKVVFVLGFGNEPVSRDVAKGDSATAPDIPQVDGYVFNGWDKGFLDVTENLTVTAQWKRAPGNQHTVVFVDGYSYNPLKIQRVVDGQAATPPEDPTREGYTFDGWDTDFDTVMADLTVVAQWLQDEPPAPQTFTVTFVDGQGTTLKTQEVEEGKAATAPADPTREGYAFDGWDADFSNVTKDLTVVAQWKQDEPEPGQGGDPEPGSKDDPEPEPGTDPEPAKKGYACTSGNGSSWTKGAGSDLPITFKRDAAGESGDATFAHFLSASVDGKELVGGVDYEASEGSVVIALKAAFLEGLSVGERTLAATFDDGEASATFTVAAKAQPKPAAATPANGSSSNNGGASAPTAPSSTSKAPATSVKAATTAKAGDATGVLLASALVMALAGAVGIVRARRHMGE